MRIVVIDDEMYALQSFLNEIIDYNVECKFFRDDERAVLEYILKNNVDAVFTDVGMPGVDGLKLAGEIVSLRPEISIVFITGMTITMADLSPALKRNTVGFLYKPYHADKLTEILRLIEKRTPTLYVRTFDSFDCFSDGKLVVFSSGKAKELFALLIVYNGNSLTMTDAIDHLWQDANVEKAKVLYRNAVFRLRKTLADIGVNCVTSGRAVLSLDKTNIRCDYWDYLQTGGDLYHGEFLKSYDWSVDYLPELDRIASSGAPQGRRYYKLSAEDEAADAPSSENPPTMSASSPPIHKKDEEN